MRTCLKLKIVLSFFLLITSAADAFGETPTDADSEFRSAFFTCEYSANNRLHKKEIALSIGLYECSPFSIDTKASVVEINRLGAIKQVAILPWITDFSLEELLLCCELVRNATEIKLSNSSVANDECKIRFPRAESVAIELSRGESISYRRLIEFAPAMKRLDIDFGYNSSVSPDLLKGLLNNRDLESFLSNVPVQSLMQAVDKTTLMTDAEKSIALSLCDVHSVNLFVNVLVTREGVDFQAASLSARKNVIALESELSSVESGLAGLGIKSMFLYPSAEGTSLIGAVPDNIIAISIRRFTPSMSAQLKEFSELESLSIDGEIENSVIEALQGISSLKSLSLESSPERVLNVTAVEAALFSRLESIRLNGLRFKSNEVIDWEVGKLKKLAVDSWELAGLVEAVVLSEREVALNIPFAVFDHEVLSRNRFGNGLTISILHDRWDMLDRIDIANARRLITVEEKLRKLRFRVDLHTLLELGSKE